MNPHIPRWSPTSVLKEYTLPHVLGAWVSRFVLPVLLVVAGLLVIRLYDSTDSSAEHPTLSVSGSALLTPPTHPVAITDHSTGESHPFP